MSLYLAVDAGGTNTTYLLADEHRELGRTKGSTIKRMRVSAEEASRNLRDALSDLERESGVKVAGVDYACIGTAGETVPLVVEWIRDELGAAMPKAKLLILGDVEIALDAAFPGGRGVLLLAGTGSNACGRTVDGRMARAGGWGPVIGDQGSGYWIGREALRQAFLAMDNDQPTLLLQAIQSVWGVHSIGEMVAYAHTVPAPDFSRLSRIVVNCADEGDAVAAKILHTAGEDLAQMALIAMKRVREMEGKGSPVTGVAIAGSILKRIGAVRSAMTAAIHRADASIEVRQEVVDPVLGALWRARQMHTA